jgi:hypothetical protein
MPHGKTSWLTAFGEIIAATSENYRKPMNTLGEQNSETLMLRQVVHTVTIVL